MNERSKAELLHCGGGDVYAHLQPSGIRAADVAAGIHVKLLILFAAQPGARVLLPRGVYALVGDEQNAAHLHNDPRPAAGDYGSEERAAHDAWEPEWRLGYALLLAPYVTLIGQEEGVELAGGQAALQVRAEGVRFVSLDLPRGVEIASGGSLSMEKCTSTGDRIYIRDSGKSITITVRDGASLVMEDCRIFGSGGTGVECWGKMVATRCTFEDNRESGVAVFGGEARLAGCVVRNNRQTGLSVAGVAKLILEGGTVTGNKRHGVVAFYGGKVTVAAADSRSSISWLTARERSEETASSPAVDRPQTVSSGNGDHDWATGNMFGLLGAIEGLADGIISHRVERDADE